jgi:hypothetical protein
MYNLTPPTHKFVHFSQAKAQSDSEDPLSNTMNTANTANTANTLKSGTKSWVYGITDGRAYRNAGGEWARVVKIGKTNLNLATDRIEKLRNQECFLDPMFECVFLLETEDPQLETKLHRKYKADRVSSQREWFFLAHDRVPHIVAEVCATLHAVEIQHTSSRLTAGQLLDAIIVRSEKKPSGNTGQNVINRIDAITKLLPLRVRDLLRLSLRFTKGDGDPAKKPYGLSDINYDLKSGYFEPCPQLVIPSCSEHSKKHEI